VTAKGVTNRKQGATDDIFSALRNPRELLLHLIKPATSVHRTLQRIDCDNRLVAFERSELREWGFMQTPPMPSYSGTLNTDELADVLAYLASLKGVSHP
jgi:hypothetical protein